MTDWKALLAAVLDGIEKSGIRRLYADANAAAVMNAIDGKGPDDKVASPEGGARAVVNMSSAHIPAFCLASDRSEASPYKNGYDLGKYRLGDDPPASVASVRLTVDAALPLPDGRNASEVYFAAVELGGTGIRFYGDACMVLRRGEVDVETVVLDRNSYDLVRSPLVEGIEAEADQALARREKARQLAGKWGDELGHMGASKAGHVLGWRTRRLTGGQVSAALLDDEDYMEVLKVGSFGAGSLQEVRWSAGEAAVDALAGERLRGGPAPSLETLLWRDRRKTAEAFLSKAGVPSRVVSSVGRHKG